MGLCRPEKRDPQVEQLRLVSYTVVLFSLPEGHHRHIPAHGLVTKRLEKTGFIRVCAAAAAAAGGFRRRDLAIGARRAGPPPHNRRTAPCSSRLTGAGSESEGRDAQFRTTWPAADRTVRVSPAAAPLAFVGPACHGHGASISSACANSSRVHPRCRPPHPCCSRKAYKITMFFLIEIAVVRFKAPRSRCPSYASPTPRQGHPRGCCSAASGWQHGWPLTTRRHPLLF